MTSFLSRRSFERFRALRQDLLDAGLAPATAAQPGVAGLFLPWSGQHLAARRGIYWIGAGTEGRYGAEEAQSYEACHERVACLCDGGAHARAHTPVWLFLDDLTRALLGGSYDATAGRWGWSNLLKVGWSEGPPAAWPGELIERQQQACAAALREECAHLRDSLICVAALDDFGILGEALDGTPDWVREHDDAARIWWFRDRASGNLFVHGCDPTAARQGMFSPAALDRTILLARDQLPRLA